MREEFKEELIGFLVAGGFCILIFILIFLMVYISK